VSAFNRVLKNLNAREHQCLASFSTLKVGGLARFFVVINTIADLIILQKACLEYEKSWHLLSGGSNTLFSDNIFDGVIIKLGPAFDYIEYKNNFNMHVGAATSFAKLTKKALNNGWSNALGWCGIPGLVGGALFMNAGTRLGEIKDAVHRIYGVYAGERICYERDSINFTYRNSNLDKNIIITHVDLAHQKNTIKPLAFLLEEAANYRERRRLTQPSTASLGSFFKNPYPLFAAELIEGARLKGFAYKNAQISPLHANFIVNNGGALAQDILYVAKKAQDEVYNSYGVKLMAEAHLVGDFDERL
jgi:UDP-N-acetylmuramate dehydrogenase